MRESVLDYDEVIPWGRSFRDYCRMFDLDPDDLPESILDCGAGPSSFCAKASERGADVVAVDPIYQYSRDAIRQRLREVTPRILERLRDNSDRYVFDRFESPEEVIEGRHESIRVFLDDYPDGREEGRYQPGTVLDLDFESDAFDLALSSHFLFLYDEYLSAEFHRKAVETVVDVAEQLRVFPLKNLRLEPSSCLPEVAEDLTDNGHELEVHEVPYEFQRGANQMLEIR